MTIVRLHHAQITIPKGAEEEAREFYCRVLGMREEPKPESLTGRGGFWLQLGDMQVHVGTEDRVDRMGTKSHLAYEVTDLARWRTRLTQMGFTIDAGPRVPGYERFEFRDPFGNRVEFLQRIG